MKRDPKPDYRGVIENAIRTSNMEAETHAQITMSDEAVRKMANRIMLDLRDAGIVIALDDGTDYAHRSPRT